MIRTFAAIKVDPNKELSDLFDFCKKHFYQSNVKWVEPHNLHITLRFFGNTETETIPTLVSELKTIAQHQQPFDFELKEIGIFGPEAFPRIIYAGVADQGPIQFLSTAIEQLARRVGFEPQNSVLTPHLTLGRPKGIGNEGPTRELIQLFNHKCLGCFHTNTIYLYQSVSTGTGPLYQPIEIIPLKG